MTHRQVSILHGHPSCRSLTCLTYASLGFVKMGQLLQLMGCSLSSCLLSSSGRRRPSHVHRLHLNLFLLGPVSSALNASRLSSASIFSRASIASNSWYASSALLVSSSFDSPAAPRLWLSSRFFFPGLFFSTSLFSISSFLFLDRVSLASEMMLLSVGSWLDADIASGQDPLGVGAGAPASTSALALAATIGCWLPLRLSLASPSAWAESP